MHLAPSNPLDTENSARPRLECLNELREAWDRGVDDFVPQNNRKRLISDHVSRTQDRMAEPPSLWLTDVTEIR